MPVSRSSSPRPGRSPPCRRRVKANGPRYSDRRRRTLTSANPLPGSWRTAGIRRAMPPTVLPQSKQSMPDHYRQLVILDVWLEGSELDGMDVLDGVMHRHPEVPVIMISGHSTIDTAVAAIKKGAYEFIEKPLDSDRLLITVARALEAAELRREVAELKLRAGETTELIGSSPAIKQIRTVAERAAPTDRRVFITGPAGAGKEVLARLIHSRSRRSSGPFVVANAAMMRPERVELELFGSEGDGLAAAGSRKIGTFERAHRGTLFFDEIADMPFETQGKIARALQAHTFEREGGSQRIEVDIRVMAATTRDMENEIEQGRFREDLYYRLLVTPIEVPALRDRREDIPELASFFIRQAADSAGVSPREIGSDGIAMLQSFDWPGNVRQLRNFVEWLLIMAPMPANGPIGADMIRAASQAETGSGTGALKRGRPDDAVIARRPTAVRAKLSARPNQTDSVAISRAPLNSSAWSARHCIASCVRWACWTESTMRTGATGRELRKRAPLASTSRTAHEGHRLRRRPGRRQHRAPACQRGERRDCDRQRPDGRAALVRHGGRAGNRRQRIASRRARRGGRQDRRDDRRRDPLGRGQHGGLPGCPFALRRTRKDRASEAAELPEPGLGRALQPRPHADRPDHLARDRGRPCHRAPASSAWRPRHAAHSAAGVCG